jgi:hypothetical protein
MFEPVYWFYSVGAEPILRAAMQRKPLWYRTIHAPDSLSANGAIRRFAGPRSHVHPEQAARLS